MLKKCDHLGCKNHVTHPCEKCGYQAKKGPTMAKTKTFWLARDHHRDKDCSLAYKISATKMHSTHSECEWRKCYYVDSGDVMDIVSVETIRLLGLPTLRKGQQVQIKRTNNGFEIVKGKENGK